MKEVSIKVEMTVPDDFDTNQFCLATVSGDYPELAEEFCRSVASECYVDKEDIENDFQIGYEPYND